MDFRDLREKTEGLIEEIKVWIDKKSISESSKKVKEVQDFILKLREKAENDVQGRAVLRLASQLEYLAEEIDEILSKREAGKKEDGNVAFKCNWNDNHYMAACTQKAYEFNIDQGRAWCNSPDCRCREYVNKVVTIEDDCCYESIALKEMFFGAGWDHTGERKQPRHIYSVRQGRMAILTTRSPGAEEKDRLVIGCLFIERVQDDPGAETKIYGDKEKSIIIDYEKLKIKFWDYYKNAGAPDLVLWASGLFRYITDETVLNILKGIGEEFKNYRMDVKKIVSLIKYYEDIVQRKK
jgi:hypothetical protein